MSQSKRAVYVEARTRLLEQMTTILQNDERFVAAWLAGSFGRGEQRWLSDLDIHVVVAEKYSETLCATPWLSGGRTTDERLALFKQFGTPAIIFDVHHNNLIGGTFTYVAYLESAQNVDWMLIPQAKAHREYPSLVLFDKVGIPEPPAEVPPSREESVEWASSRVGFFWMIASANAKNLLDGSMIQFHTSLDWLEGCIRDVQAALRGERGKYTKHVVQRVFEDTQECATALLDLCDEMEALMPLVVEMGGHVQESPRTVVEMRLALLDEA